MDLDPAHLPEDAPALKALVQALIGDVKAKGLRIAQLEAQIAKLKRMQFGRSSEKLDREIAQLELELDELTADAEAEEAQVPAPVPSEPETERAKPKREPLPAHLPREEQVHAPACLCSACGGEMRKIGEDVTEVLEYVPASFKVIREVRPKLSCRVCETIAQAPVPARPILRGRPGPGLLAHVLVAKYADHLPLYRQSEIYAREGVDLARSTLSGWVGASAALLDPLVEALKKDVLGSPVLFGDDTPVPVLCPGLGRTKTGRLWAYARDERPHGGERPPAAVYFYSPDRKGEHPQAHLGGFRGALHADGYAGFNALFETAKVSEVACWAHVRRKFFDIHAANASALAKEALERIGALYGLEALIRGQPPDERREHRQTRASPLIANLKAWLEATLPKLSGKSELAQAMRYALNRWPALTRYLDDGRLEIDNNAAERALRAVALGRKNYLFAGSDAGGERAAAVYTLVETAKLNGLDPQAYLGDVLARIGEHKITRIAELLPWAWARSQTSHA